MTEIYTSAETAALSTLSQEATDHINAILSGLGLGGTSDIAVQSLDAGSVLAEAGDKAIVAAVGHTSGPIVVDDGGHDTAVILAGGGEVRLAGLGDDTVFASLGGNTIVGGAGNATIHGGLGDDSIFGGTNGGSHQIFSGGGHDTLVGGSGMDTLWGATGDTGTSLLVGGANGHTQIHAGDGGDTILSAGAYDTIHGGGASIDASGDHATIFTFGDTISAHGDHALIDGSQATIGSRIDVFGSRSTVFGGAGNDTITLHDGMHGLASIDGGAGDDFITGSHTSGSHLLGGAGDDRFLSYGLTDSVSGGDGSDFFTLAGYGTGLDTISGGAGDDTLVFQDRNFADAHVTVSGATTLVSFDDGYRASIDGVEHLRFKDTIFSV
ncbi:calcium-binding protein [Aurantimonas sp. Leaf443]|uniref:calcium-binding protein n=1 Tax=Aurantimonas sp. Leaf443 TaxID=1736378 RepID=UPI0006FEC9CC|nr:calcium-binding protein [Aurantimonas sp. Leaf443]KQT82836.1 hypothetical protein ASG48_15225 [Aurantimonas sp. Leaf443]